MEQKIFNKLVDADFVADYVQKYEQIEQFYMQRHLLD